MQTETAIATALVPLLSAGFAWLFKRPRIAMKRVLRRHLPARLAALLNAEV